MLKAQRCLPRPVKTLKWLQELNEKYEVPLKLTCGTEICCTREASFSATQKAILQQHLGRGKHKKNMELKRKRLFSQAELEDLTVHQLKRSKSDVLGLNWCEAFLSANIPWYKLEDQTQKPFLEVDIGISIPDESTLRKKYLNTCYDDVLSTVQTQLQGSPIWIDVYETTMNCNCSELEHLTPTHL